MAPPEKKAKKEKASTSKAVKPTASSSMVDTKIGQLDEKWSDRFNRMEALLLARTIEPSFQPNVKVTPTHPPPASAAQSIEPFIKPVQPVPTSTEFPGSGFSAVKHQPTSQTENNRQTTADMLPGTGSSATKHQPTSKTKFNRPTSSAELPGTGSSAAKHQPTSKAQSNRPTSVEPGTGSSTVRLSTSKHRPQSNRPSSTDRPMSSDPQDTGSPALHRSRRDSSVSSSSEAGSDLSERPPLEL